MKNKKKKKGFTLIELIAVIAILGVLAAIAVPSVSGYVKKAERGKAVADAGLIVRAIEAYNAEQPTAIAETDTVKSALAKAEVAEMLKSLPDEYDTSDITIATLRSIANKTVVPTFDGDKDVNNGVTPVAP